MHAWPAAAAPNVLMAAGTQVMPCPLEGFVYALPHQNTLALRSGR